MRRLMPLVIALVFLAFGIFLLVMYSNTAADYKQKETYFLPVTAKVVDYEEHRSTDSKGHTSISYMEVVEYAISGKTYQKTSSSGSSQPRDLGTIVELKYNPNNPLDVLFPNLGGAKMFLYIGIALIVIGVLVLLASIRTLLRGR